MLPVSRSAILPAPAPSPPPRRAQSQQQAQLSQQLQQRQHRRQLLQLSAVCVLLFAASVAVGARLGGGGGGGDDDGAGDGNSFASRSAQVWRARRARQEALERFEAEPAPGLLRRAREREEVLERLRQGRCRDGGGSGDGGGGGRRGWRAGKKRREADDDDQDAAAPDKTEPEEEEEETTEQRLAKLAEKLSRHVALHANLTSAQIAELNHNGYEDASAARDDPDDTDFRVLCVGDAMTLGHYEGGSKYRPYAIALERALRDHLSTQKHREEHMSGSEDRHEHGAPKKRLERKRHRATSVHVVAHGITGDTVLGGGGMKDRLDGLLKAAETSDGPARSKRYDVVVILGGINDIMRDQNLDANRLFTEGLRPMYSRARRGHGAATLAVTLPEEGRGGDSERGRREEVNRRIKQEAAEAFAHDLQSAEIRRMDGDWSDGGVGPLGVFDAAAALPFYEKEEDRGQQQQDGDAAADAPPPEKRRTKWFDIDKLLLSYDGYERLGEMMAQRIVEMGWL